MNIEKKKEKLLSLYDEYEKQVAYFKKDAACVIGCADCCIDVGNIDITTLEGIIIQNEIHRLPEPLQSEIKDKLIQNKSECEKKTLVRCAFLNDDKTCLIYPIRPFSCRQLYSIKRCNGNPPVMHRFSVLISREIRKEIQQLDSSGYSGHISYILYLLDDKKFRESYIRGHFEPQKIAAFGKSHKIFINRFVTK